HFVSRFDGPGHRVVAAEESVGVVDLACVDEASDLRAVEGFAFEGEGRHHVHLMAGRAKPFDVALPFLAEREVESDHPALELHHRAQAPDELVRGERGQATVEPQHDGVLDAGRLDQRQLLLECGDGLGAVRRIQHAARVRLEGDQGGRGTAFSGRRDGALEHVKVAHMHAVVAADGDGDRTDRAFGKPKVSLQLNTFSGTNVRRSGSVWPSATRRPPESWARSWPGPGSGRTLTARPWRTIA